MIPEEDPALRINFHADESRKEHEKNVKRRRPLFPQFLVVCGSYLISLSCGISQGHSAVLLPQLKSPNSTLPTDTEMASWIASIHVAVNPLGSIVGGFLMDWCGRRKTVIIGTVPYVLGWVLIATAQNHVMILAGRCLDGIAKGIVTTSRMVHLDELADPKIRGTMAGSVSISFVSGILFIYLLGGILHWRTASWLAAVVSLAGFTMFWFLPESPVWLLTNKGEKEAAKALQWMWGPGQQNKIQADLELREIESTYTCKRGYRLLPTTNVSTSSKCYVWKSLFVPYNLKPFLIIHVFNLFQVFCGTQLTIFYAMDLISSMTVDGENSYSLLLGVLTAIVRLVFVIILCFLVYFIGRRTLAISSGIGSTVSTLLLGTILYIQATREVPLFSAETEKFVSLGLVLSYIGASTCGFFSLPFIMAGEVIPSTYRGVMCGYIFAINDVVLFGMVKAYPFLFEEVKSYGIFWMFGVSCLACTIFVYIFLPETQGKPLALIEDYFKKGNTFWITRQRNKRCADVAGTYEKVLQ